MQINITKEEAQSFLVTKSIRLTQGVKMIVEAVDKKETERSITLIKGVSQLCQEMNEILEEIAKEEKTNKK